MTSRTRYLLQSTMISVLLLAGPALAEPQKTVFFGIHFINTSMEPVSDAERERLVAVEERLIAGLKASGKYTVVDIEPVRQKSELYTNLSNCNGCDTDLAAELGADVAVTGEIQKTSNLILGMSIYIREAGTGALLAGGSADMRGNTDQSWYRTVDWLLRNRLLKE
ncbi:DUF3280 domain-containing protein [Rhodobacteraceae bacterium NNCM2]|nr:DUF3280 domain-containing protein [Coraliihabitans acroporae]